jgi:protein-L-isoaspartate(D-aspartate) O-methyltransferase
MLTELRCHSGERALVVGAGSGYSSAVLAHMGLSVVAVENDPVLLEQLRALPGVTVHAGPLEEGAPAQAPFDLILVDGEVDQLPDALVDQLRTGGRLSACLVQNGVPRLVLGTRSIHGFGLKSFADASMAPLPGFARPAVFTF